MVECCATSLGLHDCKVLFPLFAKPVRVYAKVLKFSQDLNGHVFLFNIKLKLQRSFKILSRTVTRNKEFLINFGLLSWLVLLVSYASWFALAHLLLLFSGAPLWTDALFFQCILDLRCRWHFYLFASFVRFRFRHAIWMLLRWLHLRIFLILHLTRHLCLYLWKLLHRVSLHVRWEMTLHLLHALHIHHLSLHPNHLALHLIGHLAIHRHLIWYLTVHLSHMIRHLVVHRHLIGHLTVHRSHLIGHLAVYRHLIGYLPVNRWLRVVPLWVLPVLTLLAILHRYLGQTLLLYLSWLNLLWFLDFIFYIHQSLGLSNI